ncbi:hypothetical protein H5410_048003 [Solanum commersonii]|uniref:Uncharacterized protein n=1 Tax=Solanum commersonii TaxID=4109 RepID=A0A9J5XGT8_SOLCO|nr:hypothetical protein H5410_048003 [Solanum commersonii]
MDCVVCYDDEVAPTKIEKFYGGFIVWVYIIQVIVRRLAVLMLSWLGLWAMFTRDRAYEIVHIILVKCFAYGRWLISVQPEELIALHDCYNALHRSLMYLLLLVLTLASTQWCRLTALSDPAYYPSSD